MVPLPLGHIIHQAPGAQSPGVSGQWSVVRVRASGPCASLFPLDCIFKPLQRSEPAGSWSAVSGPGREINPSAVGQGVTSMSVAARRSAGSLV